MVRSEDPVPNSGRKSENGREVQNAATAGVKPEGGRADRAADRRNPSGRSAGELERRLEVGATEEREVEDTAVELTVTAPPFAAAS